MNQAVKGPRLEKKAEWHFANPWRIALDFTLVWAQIVGAIALYGAFPNALTLLFGIFLVAGGQHGLALIGHEAAHYLIYPKNKKLNDLIGQWLFIAPSGNSLPLYRKRHFAHHRLYSTKDDTKILYKRKFAGWRFLFEIAVSLLGIDYFWQVFNVLKRMMRDERQSSDASLSFLEVFGPPLISQAVIAAVLCRVSPFAYFALWIYPMIGPGVLFSKLRSTAEHLPFHEMSQPHPTPNYLNTAQPFVRTVCASWFERLCLCKINFCYHFEHHLFPDISYQYLPLVHEKLLAANELPAGIFETNYAAVLSKLIQGH